MTYRSVKRATGTTLAFAASSTLLLTALAGPASAAPASHENTVRVTVCKEVDDGDHHHGRGVASRGEEFDFTIETDEDWEDFTLEDGDCKRIRLQFDDNKVVLEEENADGYDVSFDVSGDEERVRERGDKVTVWIDEDEDRPRISIDVTNEEEHHHH